MRNSQGLLAVTQRKRFNDPSNETPVDNERSLQTEEHVQQMQHAHRACRTRQDDCHVVPIEWHREAESAHQYIAAEGQ